jgi:small subunit ribosomal protein S20
MGCVMRTAIKKVIAAISSKDKTKATAAYQDAVSNLDSMSNKGIIHKNKAARHKSRLNSKIKAMA